LGDDLRARIISIVTVPPHMRDLQDVITSENIAKAFESSLWKNNRPEVVAGLTYLAVLLVVASCGMCVACRILCAIR
jgi:hypothetical protein